MNDLVFLLSPANSGGKRASYLINPEASFDLALRLRTGGITLAEAFSVLSGLYFRGKLAYANRFARLPENIASGALVITTNRGLLPAETHVTLDELKAMGTVPIDVEDERYCQPLVRDVQKLGDAIGTGGRIVLLGSIATGKYCSILTEILADRLLFPVDFVGRGDMSRGALMLRAAAAGKELAYVPVLGATVTGRRAPKVEPMRKPGTSVAGTGRSRRG